MAKESNQPLRESSKRITRKGKGSQGEELTSLSLPGAFCIEIEDPQTPETLGPCQDTSTDCCTFPPILMAIALSVRTAACLGF
jgi:hypothetical protein